VAEAASRVISCPDATNLISCIESQRTAPPAIRPGCGLRPRPPRSLFAEQVALIGAVDGISHY
jgi:hypothetical protein